MYYAILFTENPTSNYAAYIPIRVYARSLTATNQGPAPAIASAQPCSCTCSKAHKADQVRCELIMHLAKSRQHGGGPNILLALVRVGVWRD